MNSILQNNLAPETVKALNDLLCSIFVPFEGAEMIIDLDDPNSIFQLARLACSSLDTSKLTCRSRWMDNQERGLGDQSMLVAMCGAAFTSPETLRSNRETDTLVCQFCSCTVVTPSNDFNPHQVYDLVSLIQEHTVSCPYRWFLTHQRVSSSMEKRRPLSYDNAALVSHLQKTMSKMDTFRQFGFSSDVIATALLQRYLRLNKQGRIDELEINENGGFVDIDVLMDLLSESDAPAIPGLASHIGTFFQEEEEVPEFRVWPRIKARYQRPNYYLRQVVLLPRVKEEIEVAE